MEHLFKPSDVVTYNQLMEWDKNELAEYILNCTYIRFAEDITDEEPELTNKIIATI